VLDDRCKRADGISGPCFDENDDAIPDQVDTVLIRYGARPATCRFFGQRGDHWSSSAIRAPGEREAAPLVGVDPSQF
jgi:hypothetical protein